MAKEKKRIERVLLWTLIIGAVLTFGVALLSGYQLTYTDYAGILGIMITSLISFMRPDKSLGALFIILVLGTFNLLSFLYFINLVFYLAKSSFVSPGIQIYSLVLLILLIRKRKAELKDWLQRNFGQSEEDFEKSREAAINGFLKKFENLSDNEVMERLDQNLVPEAKEALISIKKERGL